MTCKDRTSEFKSIAEFLEKNRKIPLEKKNTRKEAIIQTISVNKRASEIGRKTSVTAAKLKELTELAKSQSPFGDPTEKIESLTVTIAQDISVIKIEIEQLESIVSRNGGSKQSSDHSVTVIHSLNNELLTTTKGLNDALQVRTQNLKALEERRRKIIGDSRPGPAPKNFKPYIDRDFTEIPEDVVIEISPMLQTEDILISQRADQVKSIESHITEIQTIFKKLSSIVAIQHEQLERIGGNLDLTSENADSALAELLKYLKGMSSDRWLIIKAFLIVIFFLFIWFMFFCIISCTIKININFLTKILSMQSSFSFAQMIFA